MIDSCNLCGFYDLDSCSCSCPSSEMWYACPLTPEPSEEDFKEHGFDLEKAGLSFKNVD